MHDISFTFGFVTDSSQEAINRLKHAIHTINVNHIPEYEIIIVGNRARIMSDAFFHDPEKIHVIDFDESIKPMWITRKKNIIVERAKYDNIVLSHDYFYFDAEWYVGWKKFFAEGGSDYKMAINPLVLPNGERYRDLSLFPWPELHFLKEYAGLTAMELMLPYPTNYSEQKIMMEMFSPYMYISGGYFTLNREIAVKYKHSEEKVWGTGDDCELCSRFKNDGHQFTFNPYSKNYLGKVKDTIFGVLRPESYKKAVEFILKQRKLDSEKTNQNI